MTVCGITAARNICMGLYFFLCGVEYAVILPTINGYLISLKAEQTFLGIVLASFSFAGLIGAPLYGYIADKTGSTKACIVVGNLCEVVGNFLYFMGRSKYLIWSGRLIAGFGSGAASTLFGLLTRTTESKERTSMFAMLMGLRQIGLLVGPGFNAFLYKLDFKVGPFLVDENTSPGIFMAILWLLHTVLFLILFKDIDRSNATSAQDSRPGHPNNINSNNHYGSITNREIAESDEARIAFPGRIKKSFVQEFLREEVIVCLATAFLVMFVQTGLETAITPMTLMYFNWSGLTNSVMLCAAGFVVIISFASVYFLSKRFLDRTLLLVGCLGLVLTYAIFLAYVAVMYNMDNVLETPSWLLPVFCIDCAILTISIAYLFVPQVALFSKITSKETQSFNQGIRMVAMRLGQIVGPLWASSMVTTSRLPLMAGVDLVILCVLTSMVVLSFNRLLPPPALINSVSESSSLLDEVNSD